VRLVRAAEVGYGQRDAAQAGPRSVAPEEPRAIELRLDRVELARVRLASVEGARSLGRRGGVAEARTLLRGSPQHRAIEMTLAEVRAREPCLAQIDRFEVQRRRARTVVVNA
jgi:hypothetical protein